MHLKRTRLFLEVAFTTGKVHRQGKLYHIHGSEILKCKPGASDEALKQEAT